MSSLRERNPAALGVIGLVLLTLAGLLTYFSDDLPVIGGGTTYRANFAEAAGLRAGDEVRVAGVGVGEVTGVRLDGDHVVVTFEVDNTWVGNASTVAIKIGSLLGAKYLAVDPFGARAQDPGDPIPVSRTTAPYDVTEALGDLAATTGKIDVKKLARSFETLSDAFSNTPSHVRNALEGLTALSETISSRDAELSELLANARQITATLSGHNRRIETLLRDGNLLLAELRQRRKVISALLTGTRQLANQLSGLVADNREKLAPTLRALEEVTSVLQRNQRNLHRALALAGPYYRLINNALGNGRWLDSYVCGVIPAAYLPEGAGPEHGCMPPRPGGGS